MKRTRMICLLLAAVLLGGCLFAGCGSKPDADPTNRVELPFENNGKQPSQYTWEEYLAMDESQKLEFQKSFGSQAVFEAWKEKAQRGETDRDIQETTEPVQIDVPWDKPGAKQPEQYTWEEFEALTAELQIIFQNSFERFADFEAWMQRAQEQENEQQLALPWEQGGKEPSAYSWEEFEALTGEQQMAFQSSFGSSEAFEAWMQKAQGEENAYPWEQAGAKQPEAYTWAEFEALSAEAQMAFQASFGSSEAFEAWMQEAQNPESELPWEQGGKAPEDYTWAEFEALSPEEQMRFQTSFDTPDGFEKWLLENMP